MTTPRPKRWFVWIDSWRGPYALEPKAGFMTQGEAEAHQAKMSAYYPRGAHLWILETLDEEQERKLTHYERLEELSQEVARAKIVLNEVFNFPLHKQFEEGAGGLRKRYEMAGNAWKRIAAADAALGRKP